MAYGLFPSAFFSDELYQPMPMPLTCRTAYYTERRPSYAGYPAVVLRQPAPPKPSLRVSEDEGGAMVITATLPGYPGEGIRVQVEHGILTLSAHPAPRCNCCECNPFSLPPLSKSFRLGPHIDTNAVTARFNNGVLTVRLPRKVQPRRIVIASAAAACPVAPMYCAPPAAWVGPRQACFSQPAAACVAVPAPPSPAPKPAAHVPQTRAYRSAASEPRQQGEWVRINVEGPSTSTAPSASASPASHPPAAAAAPVAVTASAQPGSQQQQQQEKGERPTPAVAARAQAAPIEPLLVAVDPAQPQASEAPAAEQAAVDNKGKQPMNPAQEVEFIKAQAEAKRIQAHLRGEYMPSDEEEDGSIEDCEF